MGEKNNALKVYMGKPERIRSVLEYQLGEKLPDNWKCEGADEFYTNRTTKGKLSFRQRDAIKRITIGEKSFLLGLENQESINLILPWRLLDMDRLVYGINIEDIQQANKDNDVAYGQEDDYKYRFLASDRLTPVLDLVLYWGTTPWERPRSMEDMVNLDAVPDNMRRFFQNYKMNLITMRDIPDSELEKMNSDLKYVLGILKRSESAKEYTEFIRKNSNYFSRIPKSAADVIAAYTDIEDFEKYLVSETKEKGEEGYNMCKALRDLQAQAERNGEKRGEKRGEKKGTQKVNKLNRFLIRDGRQEDLLRATKDRRFQQKLFEEYCIN